MDRHQRRSNRRRVGVGQTQRQLLAGDLPPEENDAVVVRDDVRHLLDQEDGRFPKQAKRPILVSGLRVYLNCFSHRLIWPH